MSPAQFHKLYTWSLKCDKIDIRYLVQYYASKVLIDRHRWTMHVMGTRCVTTK
ncbi:uncharacterized protein PHALS_00096 [Plasmopara halstedii]|uniref:Uncharacterized protein n=1 Tax=Plasmopara halstedii TaxID=4781 RepID=A0A0P1A671_PLAHL|nr:uncharacterized protein PHALS_00096 [Plasmopara halstedii]CEG35762.1 hypothetical protein PHALS_00096 [Plasmopara halstedii]|eukprot:XP_024572131.1 hypothetical protein PHALS_00096 [Plasmopara halstedii]